jgi:hypothetical protein
MRQLIYALRFHGEARRTGIDGNVLTTASTAPGCTIRSRVAADGLSGDLHPACGDEATLESELVLTGATTFQGGGTIRLGIGGHRLRFSTTGTAFLGPVSDDGRRHGAAIWRIEGGDGQFAGATGLIASTFVVDDAGEVTEHQLGVVYVTWATRSASSIGSCVDGRPSPVPARAR